MYLLSIPSYTTHTSKVTIFGLFACHHQIYRAINLKIKREKNTCTKLYIRPITFLRKRSHPLI